MPVIRALLLLCACLGLAACGAPAEAPDDGVESHMAGTERGEFAVELTAPAGGFQRGVNVFWVRARDAGGRAVDLRSVRARMPAHAHGDTAATAVQEGDRWRVEGLVLDMPGRWEVTLRFCLDAREDASLLFLRIP